MIFQLYHYDKINEIFVNQNNVKYENKFTMICGNGIVHRISKWNINVILYIIKLTYTVFYQHITLHRRKFTSSTFHVILDKLWEIKSLSLSLSFTQVCSLYLLLEGIRCLHTGINYTDGNKYSDSNSILSKNLWERHAKWNSNWMLRNEITHYSILSVCWR